MSNIENQSPTGRVYREDDIKRAIEEFKEKQPCGELDHPTPTITFVRPENEQRELDVLNAELARLYKIQQKELESYEALNSDIEYMKQKMYQASGVPINRFAPRLKLPEYTAEPHVKDVSVQSVPQHLRATWAPELAQNIEAFHNIDAAAEMTAVLSEQIVAEIDREILRGLREDKWGQPWMSSMHIQGTTSMAYRQSREPRGIFHWDSPDEAYDKWMDDYYSRVNKDLMARINAVCAMIASKSAYSAGSYVVTNSKVASALETIIQDKPEVTAEPKLKDVEDETTLPVTLPLALNVAAKTIGLDLTPVRPMAAPIGQLFYMEPIYLPSCEGIVPEPSPKSEMTADAHLKDVQIKDSPHLLLDKPLVKDTLRPFEFDLKFDEEPKPKKHKKLMRLPRKFKSKPDA